MLFYDLPLDIKNLVLSYNLGDVRLLKIKNSNIVKNYINMFKPVYKSYKSNNIFNNIHYFEIDNININNGLSYIFNLSELDKLHQKHKPLNLSIDCFTHVNTSSSKESCKITNRILTSNSLFDIYYFMNEVISHYTYTFKCMVDDFISLQLNKITIKVINDDRQSCISKCYSYLFN